MWKISLKKVETVVGFILYATGIFKIIQFANDYRRRVPIIMYHSISDNNSGIHPTCLYFNGMVVSRDTLERHIKFLSKRYNIISLNDYLDYRLGEKPLPLRPLIITFDDGFKDLHRNAKDILQRYHCPSTVFLIGNILSKDKSIWLHKLYYILDRSEGKRLIISIPSSEIKLDCAVTASTKNYVAKTLKKYSSSLLETERNDFLKRLASEVFVDDNKFFEEYYLSEDEIMELAKDLFSFGSHSMTHSTLAELDSESKKREIKTSKGLIAELIKRDTISFAYPFGTEDSWDEETIKILKEEGYVCALTTIEGLNSSNTDLYRLKRIEINDISIYGLLFRLTGLRGFLKYIGRTYLSNS